MRLLPSHRPIPLTRTSADPVTFLMVSPTHWNGVRTPDGALRADALVLDLTGGGDGAPAGVPDVVVLPGRPCWALVRRPSDSAGAEAALRSLAGVFDGLMVTCVAGTEHLDQVAELCPGTPLMPVIDSTEALRRAPSLARHPAVVRLGFTSRHACQDFTDGMLGEQSTAAWVYRIIAAASTAADLPGPVGGICPGPQDRVAVVGEAIRTAGAGFTGYCVTQPEHLADAAAALASAGRARIGSQGARRT
ncbi:hypothetical protein [Streptomyces sp. NPDC091371]|uniref:hypothetical protein n=1 Tax=Streptomyces sp. NPDC091371 TaxID=3155303 RepID=UPI003428BA0E